MAISSLKMAFIGTHHRQVTRDDVDVAKNQRVQREMNAHRAPRTDPIFRIRRGRLRGKVEGPAGPSRSQLFRAIHDEIKFFFKGNVSNKF